MIGSIKYGSLKGAILALVLFGSGFAAGPDRWLDGSVGGRVEER